jgi:lipopolysaccharide export system protein LptA
VIARSPFLAALTFVLIAVMPALAQAAVDATPNPGAGLLGLGGGSRSKAPMHLKADGGIEWQQDTKSYIARNHAVATRGDVTLRADTITAYYRDAAKAGTNEVWRVVAAGGVKITTPTQSVVGDVATYDLDQALVIVTGKGLRLETKQDIVTARDSLEWYDHRQLAVARGNAVVRHDARRVRADLLAAQIVSGPGQPAHISRVDASGHVMVTGPGQIGTGNTGVYDARSGRVTLRGNVVLVRGQDTLTGEYGVVDLGSGVSRLMPGGSGHDRIHGYVVPTQKNGLGGGNPG